MQKIMDANKETFTYTNDDDTYWRKKCNNCMMQVEQKIMQINEDKKQVQMRGEAIALNYKMEFFEMFLRALATDNNFFENIYDTFGSHVGPKPTSPVSP